MGLFIVAKLCSLLSSEHYVANLVEITYFNLNRHALTKGNGVPILPQSAQAGCDQVKGRLKQEWP